MTRRELLAEATARLRAAAVPSPEHDAAELLAHALGTERASLVLVEEVPPATRSRYADLIARRAAREPLQHLTGTAHFRHLALAVGPGVFVPRPETELLAGWAIEQASAVAGTGRAPVVVDLCTGSGAIAASLADELAEARPAPLIHAVELSEEAFAWAERNLAGTGVDLRQGDFATAFPELLGTVDVVACNPPYVPWEAWESVAPEAREHDPEMALFSGRDGLDAIRALERRAAELLRPGGVLGVEHAEVQAASVPAIFGASGRWCAVRDHQDLAGRARFTTARLAR
ncbi:MAG: peptide chain release factor N(5)-glutamine methyltransferase [Nocardioides sp.]|uniref:peptide chain release factor N(5)-glutamine methyltransferase n=1 Tax=Nocardioides sp. TaxID=35761 RepID=UPI0039E65C4C